MAAWVATVDEAAVRNTRDVDLLISRGDLSKAQAALERVGLRYRKVAGVDMFLDGDDASPREAVHVVFAGERVRDDYPSATPLADDSRVLSPGFRVLELEALVRMKLTSYRSKDRVHLADLLSVGLIDESWPARLPEPLDGRLREVLADPDA